MLVGLAWTLPGVLPPEGFSRRRMSLSGLTEMVTSLLPATSLTSLSLPGLGVPPVRGVTPLRGWVPLRALTPLKWLHINPYGIFTLDMHQRLPLDLAA